MPRSLTPLSLVFAGALFSCSQAYAQNLRITAPANGAIVHPGESLSVTVNSTGEPLKALLLVGPDPIGFVPGQTDMPASFTIKIPANTFPGKYPMTALGATASGKRTDSDPIEIDVERSDLPVKLTTQLPVFYFRSPDGSLPILLSAKFADGTTTDVRNSSKVTYRSMNPAVAQVSGDGEVTARSPGKVQVIGIYTQDGRKVEVAIAVNVEMGPVASSTYALNLADQPVGTSSSEQRVTLTAETLGPLRIIGIEIRGDFSETDNCRTAPLKTRETCTVDVRFRPNQSGAREGHLTIVNDFSSPLTISLAGTGR
ncbi:MAG: Ig-like domain-containing protein [Terracidiphilus sp.]